jgi:pimeloyl-ACP methyl ester carboxylesterase
MRDNQGSNTMRDATFSRRDMLWAGGALTVSGAFAEPLKAAAAEPSGAGPEPTSWVDSAMPEVTHRMIETNGIRLHVAEQGEGPLVILCHGFPECWYSWRHQLWALAEAGFRAMALDLRGYGRSDRPEEVEKYTVLHYVGVVVGLLDAFGAKQSVIAGHDVGAAVAWQAALLRPDRFRGVIALGPPFRPRAFGTGSVPPTTLMPRNENAVFYQRYFQTPGGAQARHPSHVPFPVLLALRRQAAVRGRRVSCRDGAPEGCSLNRSRVLAALDHGNRHRIPRPLELMAQYRPQLGAHGRL